MEKNRVIFNKKLLERSIANYSFGNLSEKIMIIKKWFEFYEKGVMDKTKETVLQGDFLTDFFGKILGYKSRLDSSDEWTMDKETKTKADETRADGALGYFSQSKTEIKAVIELKDSKKNLDERQHRLNDRSTPVEQAFSYSFKSGKSCNWVIVSNYKEIRVYNAKDSNEYEVFHISTLQNENELKKFIYLLSYETLISRQKESIVDVLYRINSEAEKEITGKFYKDYKNFRENLFNHIKEKNQNIEEIIIFEKTQKLLDRFIFVCFCEDTGLIGERTIRKLVARAKERLSRSETKIWDEMKDLFIAIDMGSPAHNINRFNGGLFAEDKIIDSFIIEDIIFEELALISDYDFASDLNVNILGHIFEQSLNDLEEIKARINGEEFDEKKGKRKKDGIFYTPEYITKYIVEQAVGGWLEERKIELGFYELPELTEDDRKTVYKNKKSDERVYSQNSLKHIEFWQKYKLVVANIKVLDPACGSGAFLNQAFDFLFSEGQRVNKAIADLKGIYSFEDLTAGILKNNIYGVDLNEESVEITKLSLWLKTANRNDPLTTLDNNIKCGNSLIDDKEVAGEKAFKWEEEFKEIMDNGGFDVVVGNPPYVNSKQINKLDRDYYWDKYKELLEKDLDLYQLFMYSSIKNMLKSNGYIGLITPNSYFTNISFSKLRNYILSYTEIKYIIDFPYRFFPFDEVNTETAIILLCKRENKGGLFFKRIDRSEFIHFRNINSEYLKKIELPVFKNDNNFYLYMSTITKKIINNATDFMKFDELFKISNPSSLDREKRYFKGYSKCVFFEKELQIDSELNKVSRECIEGDNIQRYKINPPKKYTNILHFENGKEKYINSKTMELMDDIKIVGQRITGQAKVRMIFALDYDKRITMPSVNIITVNKAGISFNEKEEKLLLLLGILNSTLINFLYKEIFGESNTNITASVFSIIPIPKMCKKEFIYNIRQKMDLLKALDDYKELYSKAKDSNNFEREILLYKEICTMEHEIEKTDKEIDKMVYELYGLTEEEIAIIEG